jgi:hypothetical protein
MRLHWLFYSAGIAAICLGVDALAFGTIDSLGQNREHERITRHALGCVDLTGKQNTLVIGGEPVADPCFMGNSINELAGQRGTFGAVGAPDNPANGMLSDSLAHCDNADYLDPQ